MCPVVQSVVGTGTGQLCRAAVGKNVSQPTGSGRLVSEANAATGFHFRAARYSASLLAELQYAAVKDIISGFRDIVPFMHMRHVSPRQYCDCG